MVTQDEDLARKVRRLRSHGITRDAAAMERPDEGAWCYEMHDLGWNYRLTDLQAALGLSQLGRIDEWREKREALASRYDSMLADGPLKRPARRGDRVSAWHLYAIELTEEARADRAEVFAGMRAEGILVNVHYIPIHTQPFYAKRGFKRGDFPNALAYYESALSLPLFPALSEAQQTRVVETLMRLAA